MIIYFSKVNLVSTKLLEAYKDERMLSEIRRNILSY